MARQGVLGVLTAACASFALAAAAQDRPVAEAITVSGNDACLDHEALAPAAAQWLGRGAVDLRVCVLVDVAGGGDAADVVAIRDGSPVAVRHFEPLPPSCDDRRTIVALGVALAIDALLLDALALDPRPPPAAPPAPTPPPPPAPTPNPSSPAIAVELAGEGGVSVGTLDTVGGIGSATLGLEIDRALRLRVGALASSIAALALGAGAVEAGLVLGRVDACLLAPLGSFEVDGCVGVLAGAVLAQGRGYAVTHSVTLPWVGLATRVEGALWLAEALAMTLAADGLFALLPARFDALGPEGTASDARTLPVGGVTVALGVRVRFR